MGFFEPRHRNDGNRFIWISCCLFRYYRIRKLIFLSKPRNLVEPSGSVSTMLGRSGREDRASQGIPGKVAWTKRAHLAG